MKKTIALILGAGASRAVAYAEERSLRSPLDSDFFELLQKLEPQVKDEPAVSELVQWVLSADHPIWDSMEETFYTLYMRARMSEVLFPRERIEADVEHLLRCFTRSIDALLRAAHGKKSCDHHVTLFGKLTAADAIITFNYDLVAERALKKLARVPNFGDWIYGFSTRPEDAGTSPCLHKLHGSVNWIYQEHAFKVRQTAWSDFDDEPGYRAHSNGPSFAIMLPYWDKKIEESPWRTVWQRAAEHLGNTRHLIVWGYSLPLTDLKALELLKLSLGPGRSPLEDVCVIDPSTTVRTRWRAMFPKQRFWPYDGIQEFIERPPNW
jgi:hypothetical protein